MLRTRKFKKLDASNFTEILEGYIKVVFKQQLTKLDVPANELIFNLGSLIYPKLMLKMLKNNA